jgi:RNA polymerase sigma-70 factor (ECF subfamily)
MTTQIEQDTWEPAAIGPVGHLGDSERARFEADLLKLAPFVRSFAQSLYRHRELAEDLAQDALLKAWRARESYKPGTNLKAWLCVILRNVYYSHTRRVWRQMLRQEDSLEDSLQYHPRQASAVDLADTLRALRCLLPDQRDAVILVGAGGYSYNEASEKLGCKVGTLKSRVTRARSVLTAVLDGASALPKAGFPNQDAVEEIASELTRLSQRRTRRASADTERQTQGRFAA